MKTHRLRLTVKAGELEILTVINAHNRPPAQRLIHHMVHAAHILLHRPRHAAQLARHMDDDKRQDRRDDKKQQRHLPVEIKQEHRQRDDGHHLAQQNRDRIRARRHELQDIISKTRDDAAGAVRIKIAHRQAQQLAEHQAAQRVHHLLRQPVHAACRRITGQPSQGKAEKEQGGEDVHRAHAAFGKAAINQWLQDKRHQRFGEAVEYRADDGEQQDLPVRADESKQTRITRTVFGIKHERLQDD